MSPDFDEVVVERLVQGRPVEATATERRAAAVRMLVADVLPRPEIATRAGVDIRTVQREAKVLGLTRTYRKMSDLAEFKRLDAAGATGPELCRRFGIEATTVRYWRRKTRPSPLPAGYRRPGYPSRSPFGPVLAGLVTPDRAE